MSHDRRRILPMNSDSLLLWLVGILTLLSITLSCCSGKQDAPTVIGHRRVISIDQQAGTVTVTLSLWADMTRTLRRCKER